MKKVYEHRWIAVLLIMLCTFSSCTSYFYSRPQPVDGKDIRSFPKKYRHIWVDEDGTRLLITKDHLEISLPDSQRVVRGYRINDRSGLQPDYLCEHTLRFDSLENKYDTILNYIVRGSVLYEVDAEGELGKGRTFRMDHDTMFAERTDTISIDMGQNAFLRQIDKDRYVLNIRASITGQSSNWWTFFIFGMDKDGTLATYGHAEKTLRLPEMFYRPPSGKYAGDYYFDAYWTKDDMARMIREGYFEKESNLKRQ